MHLYVVCRFVSHLAPETRHAVEWDTDHNHKFEKMQHSQLQATSLSIWTLTAVTQSCVVHVGMTSRLSIRTNPLSSQPCRKKGTKEKVTISMSKTEKIGKQQGKNSACSLLIAQHMTPLSGKAEPSFLHLARIKSQHMAAICGD